LRKKAKASDEELDAKKVSEFGANQGHNGDTMGQWGLKECMSMKISIQY
jgi:hypothetical protein